MAWRAPETHLDRFGTPFLLRTAQDSDAGRILAHLDACDRESTFLSREPGEVPIRLEDQQRHIRRFEETPNALFLLAEENGVLVGTLTYTGWRYRRMQHTGRFGMSVRQSHWNRGIGGLLLDAMIDWARQNRITRKIGLEVQHVNTRAIALYRSRGFVEEGRLKREMHVDGQWIDLIQMGLWLED